MAGIVAVTGCLTVTPGRSNEQGRAGPRPPQPAQPREVAPFSVGAPGRVGWPCGGRPATLLKSPSMDNITGCAQNPEFWINKERALKICILGAGALGCALGGVLTEAGHAVWLVNRNADQVEAMNRRGVVVSV